MNILNIILNSKEDLEVLENWNSLNEFIRLDNSCLIVYMSFFFANDERCKEAFDNIYYNRLAYSFSEDYGDDFPHITSYWCTLTDKYVLKITKRLNE